MELVRKRYGFPHGFEVSTDGTNGGLCLAWKGEVNVSLHSFSINHIDVLISEKEKEEPWRFIGFYGSPFTRNRQDSWSTLRTLGLEQDYPWLIYGDFNEILYSSEKKGGIPRDEIRMDAFRNTLEDCELLDMGFVGKCYTWARGNFKETNIRD